MLHITNNQYKTLFELRKQKKLIKECLKSTIFFVVVFSNCKNLFERYWSTGTNFRAIIGNVDFYKTYLSLNIFSN